MKAMYDQDVSVSVMYKYIPEAKLRCTAPENVRNLHCSNFDVLFSSQL